MRFISRRGRPRLRRLARDNGTPELQAKRQLALTAEPIDICLERMLITSPQHWSAVHFRWLYTVRYGVPSPKAVDTAQEKHGRTTFFEDPIRQAECEEEYRTATQALQQHRRLDPVLSLCVYGRSPSWLYHSFAATTMPAQEKSEIIPLREGLDILTVLWRKRLLELQLGNEKEALH